MTDAEAGLLGAAISAGAIIGGLIISGVGKVLWRWWTKADLSERAGLYGSLASALAQMRQGGFTTADIEQLKRHLEGKQVGLKHAAEIASRSPAQTVEAGSSEERYEPRTQSAMNLVAAAQVVDLESQLFVELSQLTELLNEDDQTLLHAAQGAWEQFRDAQVEYVSAQWDGGSIQPLIRSSELSQLTAQRLAQVAGDRAEREAR